MKVTVSARKPAETSADLLSVLMTETGEKSKRSRSARLPPRLSALDRLLGGRITGVIANRDFRGRSGQALLLYPDAGSSLRARRVLLVGLGPDADVDADAIRKALGTIATRAITHKASRVAVAVPRLRKLAVGDCVQAAAEGAILSAYRFDQYRETPSEEPGRITTLALSIERTTDLRAARAGASRGTILAESQNLARDLSNEPANALPPIALARAAEKVARETGLRVRVMEVPELKRRKMGALLAVGGGSVNPPRLIVLEHRGRKSRSKAASAATPTLCFVGKGITFDSGGISIKPAGGMDEMKHDMSGAATVVGALRACALLEVPQRVIGVIAAAENMPSGTAYRPGDVVKAMSGKTIEVLNTDAEGRVVLADALHYARTEYEPEAMIDLATLTGACVVALGKLASGLFSNDDALMERVRTAGDATAELAWPMPLFDGHKKAVRSQIADIKNTGGREAGASTAAAFLSHFVGDTPWVHLDIAGTGWTTETRPYQRRGATGVGVRLLLSMLDSWEEGGGKKGS